MRWIFLFLCLSLGLARAAEVKLDGEAIAKALNDQILRHADPAKNIEQIFQASGVTLYSENGAQSQGFWKIKDDQYCSVWPPSEHWACYTVTQDGAQIVFISSTGTRYPMVPKESAQ